MTSFIKHECRTIHLSIWIVSLNRAVCETVYAFFKYAKCREKKNVRPLFPSRDYYGNAFEDENSGGETEARR